MLFKRPRIALKLRPSVLKPGGLETGLKSPPVLLPGSDLPKGGGTAGSAQAPGKGNGRRALRAAQSNGSQQGKGQAKTTPGLTTANAKIRDAAAKLIEIKGWCHVIAVKEGVPQKKRDGFMDEINGHRDDINKATEALQHAKITGVKDDASLAPLNLALTKSLDSYNSYVPQLKTVFELQLLTSKCSGCLIPVGTGNRGIRL